MSGLTTEQRKKLSDLIGQHEGGEYETEDDD